MNVVPIRFDLELYEKLQVFAQLSGKPMAEIVREAIKEKMEKQPTEIKKQLEYNNPLLQLAKRVEKLPQVKYQHAKFTDDELLYGKAG